MEEGTAREIASPLARAVTDGLGDSQASSRAIWAIIYGLQRLPDQTGSAYVPEGSPTAHWLANDHLYSATAVVRDPDGRDEAFGLEAGGRRLDGAWTVAMRSESTTINEGGAFQAPGFKTAWTFSREGGEPVSIEGEITVRQDRSEVPDAGEQFAREVAAALDWL